VDKATTSSTAQGSFTSSRIIPFNETTIDNCEFYL